MKFSGLKAKARRGRSLPQDIDRYIGQRIRERRIILGLTQQQLGERIGVAYQQVLKHERGLDRVVASRLLKLAQALGVDVDFFVEGIDDQRLSAPKPERLLELTRDVLNMPRNYQEAISDLARALANSDTALVEDVPPGDADAGYRHG